MELIIRKAQPEDASRILDYLNTIAKESDNLSFGEEGMGVTLEQETELLTRFKDDPNDIILLGLAEDQLVSVGSLTHSKKQRMKHVANLGISVLMAYWDQGIGKRMMMAMIEHVKGSPDLEIIRLDVRTDNVIALHLYRSLGFNFIGRFPYQMKVHGAYVSIDSMILVVKTP